MILTDSKIRPLIDWLIQNAEANEWQSRHAAENSYCQYCADDSDDWNDQKTHHGGCEYVAMMTEIRKLFPKDNSC